MTRKTDRNWKLIALTLIGLLLSIAILYVSDHYQEVLIRERIADSTLPIFGRDLGIALMIASTVGLIFEVFFKADFLSEIRAEAGLTTNLAESGIRSIYKLTTEVNWPELFEQSKELSMVFARAHDWRGDQRDRIKLLLQPENGLVELFLPDPTQDIVMSELALRFDEDAERTKSLILDCVDDFAKMASESKGKGTLKVYYLRGSPVYSAYLFERDLVFVPYKHRKEKSMPPTFPFAKGWVLDYFRDDFRKARQESKLVCDFSKGKLIPSEKIPDTPRKK